MPDADDGVALTGGRNRGAALALGAAPGDEALVELVPVQGAAGPLAVEISQGTGIDGTTPVVQLSVFVGGELVEAYADATMDPDDERYLPRLLEDESQLLRALDLSLRSRTTSLPAGTSRLFRLEGGMSPSADDYQDALDRLEMAEEVDLVIASVADQHPDAEVRTVHQAVAPTARRWPTSPATASGSARSPTRRRATCGMVLDHADDVRSDHFVLSAPARTEGALAGLLGRQDYFQSPTFKTIASLDAPAGPVPRRRSSRSWSRGNVVAINERRRLGIIVIKGVLTSGRQINVQRTANKAVREVKAIADRYIGLLNNDGNRNSLLQQVTAMLLQMELDGALVPSTDGLDPAFKVDVRSSQNDFASGIVRVDIAIRPVRSIDYVYATILVRN